ncbi:MAG: HAD family hydrolase [Pseudoxanthomonas sp.]
MLKPVPKSGVVFLLDVDNTLLDNDRFKADLDARLLRDFGASGRQRYWDAYESGRAKLGYADYLGALQSLREELDDDPNLLLMSAFMLDYPFAQRLYPGALEAISHLQALGTPAVLSDGDVVFQPRKVQRSGLWEALQGRVIISLHKQHMLEAVQQRFPAAHYVMVDDKPRLLAEMKTIMGERLTTVFVRQGHYANEADLQSITPSPDLSIGRIGELATFNLHAFGLQAFELQSGSLHSDILDAPNPQVPLPARSSTEPTTP